MTTTTIREQDVSDDVLTATACGHRQPEDDVNTCSADNADQYCAGRCYEAHAASCPACTGQDTTDYYASWE